MKKCTLCVDRIYNENLPEIDRIPSCVRTCPAGARHFGDLGDPDNAVSQLVAERGGFDLMPEMGTSPVNKYLPPGPKTGSRPSLIRWPHCWPGGRRTGRLYRMARQDTGENLMHPAPSVILFSTLPGLGFGLLFWLCLMSRGGSRSVFLPLPTCWQSAGFWPLPFIWGTRSGR